MTDKPARRGKHKFTTISVDTRVANAPKLEIKVFRDGDLAWKYVPPPPSPLWYAPLKHVLPSQRHLPRQAGAGTGTADRLDPPVLTGAFGPKTPAMVPAVYGQREHLMHEITCARLCVCPSYAASPFYVSHRSWPICASLSQGCAAAEAARRSRILGRMLAFPIPEHPVSGTALASSELLRTGGAWRIEALMTSTICV